MRWSTVLVCIAGGLTLGIVPIQPGEAPPLAPPYVVPGPPSFFTFMPGAPTTAQQCTGASLTSEQGDAITFTRASTRACTKDDGTVVILTTGQPAVEAAGFSVEGTRTNLILQSQAMTVTGNSGVVAPTYTANQTTAPDGTLTADKYDFPAISTVNHYTVVGNAVTCSTSLIHAMSCYMRSVTGTATIYLSWLSAGATRFTKQCDLTTTWQRCKMEGTNQITGTSSMFWQFGIDRRDSANQAAQSAQSVYVWGCQLEAGIAQGAQVSSYIATTTSTVARPTEVASVALGTSVLTDGCAAATVTFPSQTPFSGRIIGTNGTSTNTPLYNSSNANLGLSDGTQATLIAPPSAMAGNMFTVRSDWHSTVTHVEFIGGNKQAGTFDQTMEMDTLYFGAGTSGTVSFGFSQGIRNVKIGNSYLGCY